MRRIIAGMFLFLAFGPLAFSGCKTLQKNPIYPAHDEVLRYELPYDLTFLRVLEAVDSIPGWDLEETEKEKGIIRVRNLNFSKLNDADMVVLTFVVKQVSRTETSVELGPDSRHTLGAGDMMKKIEQYLGRELNTL